MAIFNWKKSSRPEVLQHEGEKVEEHMGSKDVTADSMANKLFDKPLVYLINFDNKVNKKLTAAQFNCTSGRIGSILMLPNKQKYDEVLIGENHDINENIHEYDIVLLDLTQSNTERFNYNTHGVPTACSYATTGIICRFPQQEVDQQPYLLNRLSKQFNSILNKKSIIVVFYGHPLKATYEPVVINESGCYVDNKVTLSNLDFYSHYVQPEDKSGKKIQINKESLLYEFLEKYKNEMHYQSIFKIPQYRNASGEFITYEDFKELAFNEAGDIVSYAHFVNDSIVFIFPNVDNKDNFIYELMNSILPEIKSELFPNHGMFGWLENGNYLLPNEIEIINERMNIDNEYEKAVFENTQRLNSNRETYKFLHDMISETGEKLVTSVKKYLEWLGFESVIDMDEHTNGLPEEDLQIETDQGLLVIEIKGIGGTSKDSECSQIGKIRHRRIEQKRRFDVFGLYIVNHQRYVSPKNRQNPPFTQNQIKDAILDKRGLITTYELYKNYFFVEQEIVTKEEVRKKLHGTGLITLEPSLISLGKPKEVFKNGKIAIIDLSVGVPLSIGQKIYFKNEGELLNCNIESLQINEVDVKKAVGVGTEIGIGLSHATTKSIELQILNPSTEG
ncbi:hypothetical protein [Desulfovibrio desulfuricans]|uniref:hypothetical protein n=1 Tax=Desulfovibrio desulfuricans TaxID=876 RepID=UPI00398443CA